jgi:tetratricopeptide (TPR) repeat protein
MAETTRRAWSEFVRLDPGNAISWSNLGVAHFIKANILEAMGRIEEAAATWRVMQTFATQAPASQLMKDGLALHAYRLALLEAQRGKRREADEALALGVSHSKWVVDNATAGAWVKVSRPVYQRVWPVATAEGLRDYDRALELGRAVAPDLDGLKPEQQATREIHAFVLLVLHNAIASYAKGDFAAADREMARVMEARKQRNLSDLGERREGIAEQTFAALVKVRLGRPEEARALIVPALAFQRDLARRNVDDPSQRAALAAALYVAAVADAGDRAAQLAEAAALMDKLPPEMVRLTYFATWRERIAEERSRRGK